MKSAEKEQTCHPQHIVLNALRGRIEKFSEVLTALSTRLDDVDKAINDSKSELSLRIDVLENQIDLLNKQIERTEIKIGELESKLGNVDDFLKETKIKWSIWTKCLKFMKDFPGHIVAFIGAVVAIIMYLSKFFGL